MPDIPPYILLQKNLGQTPLECLELWRKNKPELEGIPLAYAGRLDPMAEGMLLVLIGDECKKQTEYHHLDKEYEFEVLFGISSDSGDVLGLTIEAGDKIITKEKVSVLLETFIGRIELPYPIFSAKTVKGKPLHTWTMENRLNEINIPTRKSEIFALELIDLKTLNRKEIYSIASEKIETIPPVTDLRKALGNDFRRPDVRKSWHNFLQSGENDDLFSLAKIRCISSSGTYMRTLAEEIAKGLNSQGLAFSINRTKIGYYEKETGWRKLF